MVTDPMIGRATGRPVVSVTAPIRDSAGRVRGLVMGITNLAEPNFLDTVGAAKYGQPATSSLPHRRAACTSRRRTSGG